MNSVELAAIGCILLDGDRVLDTCINKGHKAEYFTDPDLRLLYDAMVKHRMKGKIVDAVIMNNQFKGHKTLGDWDLYERAIDAAVTREHAQHYFSQLAQDYTKREISKIARELEMLRLENYANEDELVAKAQSLMLKLNRHGEAPSKKETMEKILESYDGARNGVCIGLPSPFPIFDAMTGGPRSGLHTIIAAPRGIGKSSLIVNWNLHLGQCNIPTSYLAMEDGAERAWARTASCYGSYSEWRMAMGGPGKVVTSDREMEHARKCLEYVTSLPIYIDGKRGMTISEIKSKASQLKGQYGIEALWIDGFKDIRRERSDEMVESARISAGLCDIAESLDIKVISTHHVTKESSKGGDDLVLEDVRGSGVILDDARMVIFLQPSGKLDCRKNNFGPTGAVELEIDLDKCQISQAGEVRKEENNEPF